MKNNRIKREIVNIIIITIGILIYSVGFTVFILPHHVVIGGMAGFSTLVYYATFGVVPVALTMYAANVILLLIGFKTLGKGFILRTVYGMTMISIFIGLLEGYFTSHPALISSTAMSVTIGAILCGLGIGVYYSHHGTCGGTDIIAAIVSHRSSISLGRVMMFVDLTIVALSFFLPFDGDLEARVQSRTETIMIGWIAILLYSYVADKYVYMGQQTLQLIIISDKWHQIAERVANETHRGVTLWDCEGYWTGTKRKIMMIGCRRYNAYNIYKIIYETDPKAYVTNSHVDNIFGNGFDPLVAKKKVSL